MDNPRIRLNGIFHHDRNDGSGSFYSYSGSATLEDGSRVNVGFAAPATAMLDASGNVVAAPNTYRFPGHRLERAKDADGKPISTREDNIPCYNLVEDAEAETPVQTGKRFEGRGVIDRRGLPRGTTEGSAA